MPLLARIVHPVTSPSREPALPNVRWGVSQPCMGNNMKSAHDLVAAAKQRIEEVPLDRAEQAVREADLVLDVREPDEYAAGHLPGAVSVPRGLLEFKLSATPAMTPRDLKVVVYCKSGGRAALAAASMKDMGYLQVVSLVGGFDGWQSAGYPVVRPEQPAFD